MTPSPRYGLAGIDAGGSSVGRTSVTKEPKVYVINPASARDQRAAKDGTGKTVQQRIDIYSSPPDAGSDPNDYLRNRQQPSLLLVLISYILGPFALLVTRQGRKSKVWMWGALGFGIASVLIVWRWKAILSLLEGRGLAVVPVVLISALIILMSLAAWTRAIFIMGRRNIMLPQILPKWIKRPGPVGALGLAVPGLGLIISGHPKRGAIAFWAVGTLILPVLVLSNATWLWNLHRGAGTVAGDTLEILFLMMGALGLLAGLTWIVQALDGARLAEHRFIRSEGPRGDTAAFALLVAIIAFAVMFEPASVAKSLDRFAVSTRHEAYRIVPLYMELAAMRLDPSQPLFAMRAADFYDGLGRHDDARIIREDLYDRWKTCVSALRRNGLIEEDGSLSASDAQAVQQMLAGENETETPVTPWGRIQAVYGLFSSRLGSK